MLSFALTVSALATVAFVQAANPLIPSSASEKCADYLAKLDADGSITSCTKPIITATSAFAPSKADAPTSADISTALSSLCSSSTCTPSAFRSELTSFYAACSDELTTSADSGVMELYDALYALIPLTESVCTKDDSGAYCVTSSQATAAKRELTIRAPAKTSSSQIITVNTTTFRSSNLAFLYLSADSPKSTLCTTCTKNILASYISFESSIPYAASLAQSPILGGQSDLYEAVLSQCGSDFLDTSGVQAFGGLSGSVGSSSSAMSARQTSGVVAAIVALAAGVWVL